LAAIFEEQPTSSFAAEALASSDVETFLLKHAPLPLPKKKKKKPLGLVAAPY
jgi:hypothetical protein